MISLICSDFNDIFDVDWFISSLSKDIKVVRRVPDNVMRSMEKPPYTMRVPRKSTPEYYIDQVLPILLRRTVRSIFLCSFHCHFSFPFFQFVCLVKKWHWIFSLYQDIPNDLQILCRLCSWQSSTTGLQIIWMTSCRSCGVESITMHWDLQNQYRTLVKSWWPGCGRWLRVSSQSIWGMSISCNFFKYSNTFNFFQCSVVNLS